MSDIEFWTQDHLYGVRIPQNHLNKIVNLCSDAMNIETGGIILGKYTDTLDCAIITDVSDAPSDSQKSSRWFYRGIKGLQKWINRHWSKEKIYYLGEWHFHPNARPNLSRTDINQMRAIADSFEYNCPEPILLILGGNPPASWEIKVYIFMREGSFVEASIKN